MLVITRKADERIVIGDGIEIRVLRVGRDGVRIGVTAPPDVPVYRSELYDAICDANAGAARACCRASWQPMPRAASAAGRFFSTRAARCRLAR